MSNQPGYWLISAQSDGGRMWGRLDSQTSAMSRNYQIQLPKLRSGTLDSLMTLSDDLMKQDLQVEGVLRKLERQMEDFGVTDLSVVVDRKTLSTEEYAQDFSWASNKYQEKLGLPDITGKIYQEVMKVDEDLRNKQTEYNQIKTQLQTHQRKQTGSLAVRSLTSLNLNKADFVETENFVTVVVCVAKSDEKQWMATYATDFLEREQNLGFYPVLLKSSKKVFEDDESSMFTCTLFRRKLQDFKQAVRDKQPRWTVRDFEFDESLVEQEKNNMDQVVQHESKSKKATTTWCKAMYGEVFRAYYHLKLIRVFVESCLRYGVPPDFQVVLMKPNLKHEKKLRDTLAALFKPKGATIGAMYGDMDDSMPVGMAGQEFYPYVYLPMHVSASRR